MLNIFYCFFIHPYIRKRAHFEPPQGTIGDPLELPGGSGGVDLGMLGEVIWGRFGYLLGYLLGRARLAVMSGGSVSARGYNP